MLPSFEKVALCLFGVPAGHQYYYWTDIPHLYRHSDQKPEENWKVEHSPHFFRSSPNQIFSYLRAITLFVLLSTSRVSSVIYCLFVHYC